MKSPLLIAGFLMMTNAFASHDIKVMDLPRGVRSEVKASFEINRELGRAWVTATQIESYGSPRRNDQRRTYQKAQVPGLSFDKETSTIMLEHEGALVECAKVTSRGRSIFRYESIKNTGCQLEVKKVRVSVDDGYHRSKTDRYHVYLKVQ